MKRRIPISRRRSIISEISVLNNPSTATLMPMISSE